MNTKGSKRWCMLKVTPDREVLAGFAEHPLPLPSGSSHNIIRP